MQGTPASSTPGERLVRRTGFGLALFTLALIAILLAVVGLVTAAAVAQMTDQSVDANLHNAAENMLIALAPSPSPSTAPTPATSVPTAETAQPTEHSEATPESGGGQDEGGDAEGGTQQRSTSVPNPSTPAVASAPPAATVIPAASPTPTPTPTPTPIPTPAALPIAPIRTGDQTPECSDTFFLVLDPTGTVVANPQNVLLSGLPNLDAAAVAAAGRPDLRTVDAANTRIRLLSEPMYALDGSISGVLQTAYVLTAHEQQKSLILQTIVFASLVGLVGAAIVTFFVTRRALSPIRAAFTAERRFVASASHELKTPVSIVHASAEILQREDLVKPEGRYLVSDIVQEADRMGLLVGDMLALASAQAGQLSVSLTLLEMRSVVAEAVDRVQVVASQRGVSVVMGDGSGEANSVEELLVIADRERLLQLLTIFIDNVIDHSPQNGVVTVAARGVDEGNRLGRRVTVDVMDQGPGVPSAERKRIFEPFARTTGKRRTSETTGLGLAIARILAARQNATIAVTDAPGGGACFSVWFARQARGEPRR